jgi:hypothetical protein
MSFSRAAAFESAAAGASSLRAAEPAGGVAEEAGPADWDEEQPVAMKRAAAARLETSGFT